MTIFIKILKSYQCYTEKKFICLMSDFIVNVRKTRSNYFSVQFDGENELI